LITISAISNANLEQFKSCALISSTISRCSYVEKFHFNSHSIFSLCKGKGGAGEQLATHVELMCGMTRLSVCQSAAGGGKCRGKVGKEVHIVFAVLFELCFSMLHSAAMQPFPCLTPALLVNLQLKAKHVLVASK